MDSRLAASRIWACSWLLCPHRSALDSLSTFFDFFLPVLSWWLVKIVGHGWVRSFCRCQPRDSADRKRAEDRGILELCEGRPVLGKTQAYRDKLLHAFDIWLRSERSSVEELLGPGEPDIEAINRLLQKYGRSLFSSG